MWFQHNGEHAIQLISDWIFCINDLIAISREEHANWPLKSCDLTVIDFFMTTQLHAHKPQTTSVLKATISDAISKLNPIYASEAQTPRQTNLCNRSNSACLCVVVKENLSFVLLSTQIRPTGEINDALFHIYWHQ